ncbi:MAG: hypothetical protein KDC49_22600 [Saprospiraceae bacterium]|nr:hypothetical protein [Saprospiraceae bacterium]
MNGFQIRPALTFTVISLGILFSEKSYSQVSVSFGYSGSTTSWVVPSGVNSITLEVWGAQGAQAIDRLPTNGEGGLGGYAKGDLAVTPGQTIYITVGGQGGTNGAGGFNGGGAGGIGQAGSECTGGPAGGGGGASDVRINGTTLADRILVGAGGGGGGRDYCNGSCQPCGCGGGAGGGGGLTGQDGNAAFDCGFYYPGTNINFGMGASQSAGGTGGPADNSMINMGNPGVLGLGGAGSNGFYDVAGGGGGGGLYGGGGGGGASDGSGVGAGGGGGGSSYLSPMLSNTETLTNVRSGDGEIIITYESNEPIPTLDQWGILALVLILVIIGVTYVQNMGVQTKQIV